MTSMQLPVVGIPWFTEASYARVLQVMDDRALMPLTYAGWLRGAEVAADRAAKWGVLPVRVMIDPETFPAWCDAAGLRPDTAGRALYAQREAHARYEMNT